MNNGCPTASFATGTNPPSQIEFINEFVIVASTCDLFIYSIHNPKKPLFKDRFSEYSDSFSLCCDQSRVICKDVFADFDYTHTECAGCKAKTVIFKEGGILPWRAFGI